MANLFFFNQFSEDIAHGVHDLSSDQLAVALCAAADVPVDTYAVLADLATIDHANVSSRDITTALSEQTLGVYKLTLTDLVLTAVGGNVPAFRYIVLYNDTPTSPADPLIGWYDRGHETALDENDTFTVDFDGSNGTIRFVLPT